MFQKISPAQIKGNPAELFGTQWCLITAGSKTECNTMTASWGGMGFLWNQPAATVYIRPQRLTHDFVDRQEHFTLSFFGMGNQRKALQLLGIKSGRDGDKIRETGLTVHMLDGQPAFAEAELVLVCRKVYRQQMQQQSFLEHVLVDGFYPQKDFHTMFIGKIENAFVQSVELVQG